MSGGNSVGEYLLVVVAVVAVVEVVVVVVVVVVVCYFLFCSSIIDYIVAISI